MTQSADTAPRLLNRIEGAQGQLGGIGRTKIYELIQSGELQTVKIGRRTFITQAAIERYVSRLAEASNSPPDETHSTASGETTSPRTGSQSRPIAGGDR